jgi:uncharacterized protein
MSVFLGACATPRESAATSSSASARAAPRWLDWAPQTFARAERERRPILVNVAAGWCHWCHVMDAEVYSDPAVSTLLDADFVAVRVDADARPDLAERYAAWGWPATALLTPDARPIAERRGFQDRDEFLALLRGIRDDVRAGRPVARRADPPRRRDSGVADLARFADFVEARLDAHYDERLGGWGTTQKYPLAPPVEELFRRARTRGDASALQRGLTTLRAELKLVDPVFGGLYQYSVPETWDAPHYEKLAVVQAGAMENFVEAASFEDPAFWIGEALRVRKYVDRFLRDATGAFLAAQDADLSHDAPGRRGVTGKTYYALDEAGRLALGSPPVDPAAYADVNGRMIAAYALLYEATEDATALFEARRAATAVAALHAPSGGYRHGGAAAGSSFHLADQVAMGRALLLLAETTQDRADLDASAACARFCLAELEDRVDGGFFAHTADRSARGIFAERRKPFEANALAARWLLRLGRLTEDRAFRDAAERALRSLAEEESVRAEGRDVGEYLIALRELLEPGPKLTVVGSLDAAATRAFAAAVARLPIPGRVVERRAPDKKFADLGRPALYVCTDDFCSAPLTDAERLQADVARVLSAR